MSGELDRLRAIQEREVEVDRREALLDASEAALATRRAFGQSILDAAAQRDAVADARDEDARVLSNVRDCDDFLDPDTGYGEHWPERRQAAEMRACSKDDRAESLKDRLALTDPGRLASLV